MSIDRKSIRLTIPAQINSNGQNSNMEKFQNGIIRPVLKTQNDLLVQLIRKYIVQSGIKYLHLSEHKRFELLENTIKKKPDIKNQILGIVMGIMNENELSEFLNLGKEIRKRTLTMATDRVMNQKELIFSENF